MASETVNGAVLHYEERGSGPPLLLVHGTGSYADLWYPVLDGLARSYRVIVYDRRSFARSSPAPERGLVEHARDAAALLNALGASPATVVGWSGGGVIALDLAASFPECVASLVLAEPAVHLTTHPTRAAVAMAARSGFHRYVRRDPASAALAMYRWASAYKTGGNAFDSLPEAWREQMLAHAPATLREMDQMIRPYPTRAAIRSIACPVTIIEGDLEQRADPTTQCYARSRAVRESEPDSKCQAMMAATRFSSRRSSPKSRRPFCPSAVCQIASREADKGARLSSPAAKAITLTGRALHGSASLRTASH